MTSSNKNCIKSVTVTELTKNCVVRRPNEIDAADIYSSTPRHYLALICLTATLLRLATARRFLSLEYFLNDQICRLFS